MENSHGIPWWPRGQDSALPPWWPRFNTSSRKEDPASAKAPRQQQRRAAGIMLSAQSGMLPPAARRPHTTPAHTTADPRGLGLQLVRERRKAHSDRKGNKAGFIRGRHEHLCRNPTRVTGTDVRIEQDLRTESHWAKINRVCVTKSSASLHTTVTLFGL